MVSATLDGSRGRFAYLVGLAKSRTLFGVSFSIFKLMFALLTGPSTLVRKWGVEMCQYYHAVLHSARQTDQILEPYEGVEFFLSSTPRPYLFPYNDAHNFSDKRMWLRDDWKKPGAVSSRSVNSHAAPDNLVWRNEDFVKLDQI